MPEFTPRNPYLVAIDSDGCAFDTMELKHKECFIPNLVNYFNLQPVSKYARQAAEFVNLYSRSRGIHRFPALVATFDLLRRREEVVARGIHIEVPVSLRQWVQDEKRPSNLALEEYVRETGDEALERCLAWSLAVNRSIEEMVRYVPPFPYVRQTLKELSARADIVVCSATPVAALRREWHEHGLDKYVCEMFGQESGSKSEILSLAEKYGRGKALLLGDAPGDLFAARAAGCLFYPVNPGQEDRSWKRFLEESMGRFLGNRFTSSYERQLVLEFLRLLPELPPWNSV